MQMKIASIRYRTFGVPEIIFYPTVCHKDVAEVFALNRQDESTLTAKCLSAVRPKAGISQNGPLSEDVVGDSDLSSIRTPARTPGGNHVTFAVMSEQGRCFTPLVYKYSSKRAALLQIIFYEQRDVGGTVNLRLGCPVVIGRIDKIRFGVVGQQDRFPTNQPM
jgi:hypothetical protein